MFAKKIGDGEVRSTIDLGVFDSEEPYTAERPFGAKSDNSQHKVRAKFGTLALLTGLLVGNLVPAHNRSAGVESPKSNPAGISLTETRRAMSVLGGKILAYYASDPNHQGFTVQKVGDGDVLIYKKVQILSPGSGPKNLAGEYIMAVETKPGFGGLPDPNNITGVMILEDMWPSGTDGDAVNPYFINIYTQANTLAIAADMTSQENTTIFFGNKVKIPLNEGLLSPPAVIYDTNMSPEDMNRFVVWGTAVIDHAERGEQVDFLPDITDAHG